MKLELESTGRRVLVELGEGGGAMLAHLWKARIVETGTTGVLFLPMIGTETGDALSAELAAAGLLGTSSEDVATLEVPHGR